MILLTGSTLDGPYVAARDRFRADFERAASNAFSQALSRRRESQVPGVNVRGLAEFDRALDRIWPTITAPELVRQLLASEERLERVTRTELTEPERRLLYRKPVERLDQVRWSGSDVGTRGRGSADDRTPYASVWTRCA